MERCAIFHKAKSNDAYAYDNNTLHIKIRTKKDDVDKITLMYGDPYDYKDNSISGNLALSSTSWNTTRMVMKKIGSDGAYDLWFASISPQWRRVKYAFLLEDQEDTVLYGERKTVNIHGEADKELYNVSNYFAFPFINPIDVYQVPSWVKDTIWYHIFPERFWNGDTSNDPEGTKPWGDAIENSYDDFGGDLQGIIDHLDYLVDLGINGIYLNPIFLAGSNHKYDTIDYFKIDPQFGDEKTFKELIDECHKRGIKVMLDIVFNHCGFYFEEFQDVVKHGMQSKYRDWFHIKDYPVIEQTEDLGVNKALNYDTFSFTPLMPKLNTENEEVKAMLLEVIQYWSENFNVDAWRLDVANEVDHNFWREFRRVATTINPSCFILGEIWHDATPWLQGDQFHSVMNYPLTDAILDYFATDTMCTEEFKEAINRTNFTYTFNINETMYNLLDSHDTARVMHIAGEEIEKVKQAYLFMFTHAGTPSIYYGDEVGMTGGTDPDCRRCMVWDEEKQDKDMLAFMKKLIAIRKENPVLGHSSIIEWLSPQDEEDVLIYKKSNEEETIYVVINRSKESKSIQLPDAMQHKVLHELLVDSDMVLKETCQLTGFSYHVFLEKLN